jgi:hypothetical protein
VGVSNGAREELVVGHSHVTKKVVQHGESLKWIPRISKLVAFSA